MRPSHLRRSLKTHSGDADITPRMAVPSEEQILALVREHSLERHAPAAFDPADPSVPVAGRVFGPEEVVSLVRASLDFWLTDGPETAEFQRALARRTGHRHAVLVNSGSSANLVALSALTSPALGRRRLRPGDEVLTVAAGFPTTVNPILQNGLVPVFVDVVASDVQRRSRPARGRRLAAHAGRDDRPHARQPVTTSTRSPSSAASTT